MDRRRSLFDFPQLAPGPVALVATVTLLDGQEPRRPVQCAAAGDLHRHGDRLASVPRLCVRPAAARPQLDSASLLLLPAFLLSGINR